MGILKKLFGGGSRGDGAGDGSSGGGAASEHCVLVRIVYDAREDGFPADDEVVSRMHALQDRLRATIEARGAGELDGDEFGEGVCTVYMYGADADRLWDAIAPVLEREAFARGSHAVRRYGGPGAREERVDLEWAG